MANYKTVRKLDVADAAYLAGLIDGEGTITLTQEHRGENRRLVVSISNNELALLRYVLGVVGAGRIASKRTYRDHHSASFSYKITNRQAIDLLRQVTPYLRSYKAQRAQLALQQYLEVTPRNGRYTPEQRTRKHAFECEFLSLRATPMQDQTELRTPSQSGS